MGCRINGSVPKFCLYFAGKYLLFLYEPQTHPFLKLKELRNEVVQILKLTRHFIKIKLYQHKLFHASINFTIKS